jgi:hypothetical protein
MPALLKSDIHWSTNEKIHLEPAVVVSSGMLTEPQKIGRVEAAAVEVLHAET